MAHVADGSRVSINTIQDRNKAFQRIGVCAPSYECIHAIENEALKGF